MALEREMEVDRVDLISPLQDRLTSDCIYPELPYKISLASL